MLYKQINYFLEVANCLSFTEAAKHKFITQQSMTKHIAALEKELGVKLFIRTTRSVNLTAAGKILRDDFVKIDQDIQLSIDRVKRINVNDSAVVSVGFYNGLSLTEIVNPLIEYLQQTLSHIQMDVTLEDMVSLRNHLIDGKIDLCITTAGDWQLWPDVKVSLLKKVPFHLVISKKHPLAKKRTLRLQDFSNEIFYGFHAPDLNRKGPYWEEEIPRKMKVNVSDLENVLMNISMCKGFACLPLTFSDANSGNYKTLPVPIADAFTGLICASRREIHNHVVDHLMQSITAYYRKLQPLNTLCPI